MVSKTVYRIVAAYKGKFKTATEAKQASAKLRTNPKASVTPVKKVAGGYSFTVKFGFATPSAKIRDSAIKAAKAHGARVTVSSKKA